MRIDEQSLVERFNLQKFIDIKKRTINDGMHKEDMASKYKEVPTMRIGIKMWLKKPTRHIGRRVLCT